MDARTIIIADSVASFGRQLARSFQRAGYRTLTADSMPQLLGSLLEERSPVLLLASDFNPDLAPSDLLRLVKQCNRHLQVILFSDQMTLASTRKVREQGIFYHALRPASADDTEELVLAVESALASDPASVRLPKSAPPAQARGPEYAPAKPWRGMLCWSVLLIALISGLGYQIAENFHEGSGMIVWLFIGFCALIVATQLLPIFSIELPAGLRGKIQSKYHSKNKHASQDGK